MSAQPMQEILRFHIRLTQSDFDRFFDAVSWETMPRPQTPPTLATIFRDGEFEALKRLGIPLAQVLHGEQRYVYHRELKPDAEYSCVTTLESQHERNGKLGRMKILSLRTAILEKSELIQECLTTLIAMEKNSHG